MHLPAVVHAGLDETPLPTPTVHPDQVTPGPLGFVIFALLVVAVVLLVLDMLRRVRRVRYREEVREMLDAEQAAREAGGDAEAGGADEEADADDQEPEDPQTGR